MPCAWISWSSLTSRPDGRRCKLLPTRADGKPEACNVRMQYGLPYYLVRAAVLNVCCLWFRGCYRDDVSADPSTEGLSHLEDARRLDVAVHNIERLVLENTRRREGLPVLSIPSVRVLKKLRKNPGTSPAELADALQLARTTISESIGKLVAAGLVAREPSPLDGRSVVLFPTKAALDVMSRFDEGRTSALRESLLSLPARERDRLLRALPALESLRRAQEIMRDEFARS